MRAARLLPALFVFLTACTDPTEPPLDPDALFVQAEAFEKEARIDKALRWYQQAANAGHTAAQLKLGAFYEYGAFYRNGGVAATSRRNAQLSEQWYRTAAKSLEQAVEASDMDAAVQLAALYDEGKGIEKDVNQSRKLLRLAASQQQPDALYMLGFMAFSKKNYTDAWNYLGQAAEADHASASYLIAQMYFQGRGVAPSFEQGAEALHRAVRLGNATYKKEWIQLVNGIETQAMAGNAESKEHLAFLKEKGFI